MTLFKHGGTCATIVSGLTLKLHQYKRRKAVKAARKEIQHDDVLARRQRMVGEAAKVIRSMGAAYLLHPENKGVNWRAAK